MKYLLMLISLSVILIASLTQIVFAEESGSSLSEEENMSDTSATLISLLKQERYEEALPFIDKILQINPNHTAALLNKGSALVKLDRAEEAISYYDRLLVLEPNHINGITSKAAALANLGKTQNALDLYDKALSIDNDNEKIEKDKAKLLSITPTVSSNDFENDDVRYDIHLRVTVRNASGELVAVIEDKYGRYMPVSFTERVFDQLFASGSPISTTKEIVEINGHKFEVGKYTDVYQTDNHYIGNFWFDAEMSGYNISVFEVYPPHVGVEPGDQLQAEWTISKRLD